MKKKEKFLDLDQFGSQMGLNELDKLVIKQKNQIIALLKKLRLKKKVSQVQLAKKLNTKQPAIARMEAGHVGDVSFDFLVRVGLVLGVSIKMVQTSKKAA